VQLSPASGEKAGKFRAAAASSGCSADLLVLPELFATGYTFASETEVLDLQKKKGRETTVFLQIWP